jgi:hypothetical protein
MKKFTAIDIIKGTIFFILSCLSVSLMLRVPSILAGIANSRSLKELLLVVFWVIVSAVALATVYSKIKEYRNEKKALQELNADIQTNLKTSLLSFSNSLGSFPVLLFLGTSILAISILKNHHMFYIYMYFFTAGLFPLAYSICTHSKINGMGLILYYGNFFNRKCIAIPWTYIEKIYLSTYETTYMASAGGRVRIPYKATQEHKAIKISIKEAYPLIEGQFETEGKAKIFSNDEIELSPGDSEVLIKQHPVFGFKRYLAVISQFANVEKSQDGKESFAKLFHYLGNMAAYLIIAMAMIGLYLYL